MPLTWRWRLLETSPHPILKEEDRIRRGQPSSFQLNHMRAVEDVAIQILPILCWKLSVSMTPSQLEGGVFVLVCNGESFRELLVMFRESFWKCVDWEVGGRFWLSLCLR